MPPKLPAQAPPGPTEAHQTSASAWSAGKFTRAAIAADVVSALAIGVFLQLPALLKWLGQHAAVVSEARFHGKENLEMQDILLILAITLLLMRFSTPGDYHDKSWRSATLNRADETSATSTRGSFQRYRVPTVEDAAEGSPYVCTPPSRSWRRRSYQNGPSPSKEPIRQPPPIVEEEDGTGRNDEQLLSPTRLQSTARPGIPAPHSLSRKSGPVAEGTCEEDLSTSARSLSPLGRLEARDHVGGSLAAQQRSASSTTRSELPSFDQALIREPHRARPPPVDTTFAHNVASPSTGLSRRSYTRDAVGKAIAKFLPNTAGQDELQLDPPQEQHSAGSGNDRYGAARDSAAPEHSLGSRYSSVREAIHASINGHSVTKGDLERQICTVCDEGTVIDEQGEAVAVVQLQALQVTVVSVSLKGMLDGLSVQQDGAVTDSGGQFKGRLNYEQAEGDLAGCSLCRYGLILDSSEASVGIVLSAEMSTEQYRLFDAGERFEAKLRYTFNSDDKENSNTPFGLAQARSESVTSRTARLVYDPADAVAFANRSNASPSQQSSAAGAPDRNDMTRGQNQAAPEHQAETRDQTRPTRTPNPLYDGEPHLTSRARKVYGVLRRVQLQVHEWAHSPNGSPDPRELTTDSDTMRRVRFDLYYTILFLYTLLHDKVASRRVLPASIFTSAERIASDLINMLLEFDDATAHAPDRISFSVHLLEYAKEIKLKLGELREQAEASRREQGDSSNPFRAHVKRKEQYSPSRPFQSVKRSRIDKDKERPARPRVAGSNNPTGNGSPMAVDAYNLMEKGKGWTSFDPLPTPGSPLDTPQRLGMRFELHRGDWTTPEEHAWVEDQFELLNELEQEFNLLGGHGNHLMIEPPQQLHFFKVRHEELVEAIQSKVLDRLCGTPPFSDPLLAEAKEDFEERATAQLSRFDCCLTHAINVWELDENFSKIIYSDEPLPFSSAPNANRTRTEKNTHSTNDAANAARMDVDPRSADPPNAEPGQLVVLGDSAPETSAAGANGEGDFGGDNAAEPDADTLRAAQDAHRLKELWANKVLDQARSSLHELESECAKFSSSAPATQPPPYREALDAEYKCLVQAIKTRVQSPVENLLQHESVSVHHRSTEMAVRVMPGLERFGS
ncbi:hypothetical protein LTR85_002555 [Meristemomyces frigidus]|nr:hypothetical protein LTR85_002555 [Meristemomyces frigidus]